MSFIDVVRDLSIFDSLKCLVKIIQLFDGKYQKSKKMSW